MIRLDRGTLQSKIKPKLIEGKVARLHAPGDALQYVDGPEHRDISELQKIVDQLPGLRVVTYAETDSENPLGHPNGLLADGTDYHEIGMVMGSRIEGDHAVASIYIHDVGALRAIEDGTKELSLGYRCTLDEQKYQRNIQLDHLSIVPRARCGASCALKTDAVSEPVAQTVPDANISTMQISEVKLSDEQIKQAVDAMVSTPACTCHANEPMLNSDGAQMEEKLIEALAKVAALEAEVSTLKSAKTDEATALVVDRAAADLKLETARADKLATEIETVRAEALAQVEAAKAARTDAEAKAFDAAVNARVEILADAATVGIEDAKSKTDREIKTAIVNKVYGLEMSADRTDEYITGMFDAAMDQFAKVAESVAAVRTAVVEKRDDAPVAADPYKKEQELSAATEAKRKNRWR